jgi:hypothetical protein
LVLARNLSWLDTHGALYRGSKSACGRKRFLSVQSFINVLGESSVPARAFTDDVEE